MWILKAIKSHDFLRRALVAIGLVTLGASPALAQAASGEPVTLGVSGPLTGRTLNTARSGRRDSISRSTRSTPRAG